MSHTPGRCSYRRGSNRNRHVDDSDFDVLLRHKAGATRQSLASLRMAAEHRRLLRNLDAGTGGFWQRRDDSIYACGPGGVQMELEAHSWLVTALERDPE